MEDRLRNKMIAKARENGKKHGKTAELDFGAGAEWMYDNLVDNLTMPVVEKQCELFVSFARFANNYGKGSYATAYEDMFKEWCERKRSNTK